MFLEVEGLEKKELVELVEYAKEANLNCAGRGSPVCVGEQLFFAKGSGWIGGAEFALTAPIE